MPPCESACSSRRRSTHPSTRWTARFRPSPTRGSRRCGCPQSAGFDALTVLAVAGSQVPRVELGTSVIPTYPRHPVALAAQALTVNAAVDGRLLLGPRAVAPRGDRGHLRHVVRQAGTATCASTWPRSCHCSRNGEVDVAGPTITAAHEAHHAGRRRARRCCWPRCSPACSSSRAASPAARSRGAPARSPSRSRSCR